MEWLREKAMGLLQSQPNLTPSVPSILLPNIPFLHIYPSHLLYSTPHRFDNPSHPFALSLLVFNPSHATNYIPSFPSSFVFISSTNSSSPLIYIYISSTRMEGINIIKEEEFMVACKEEAQIMKGRRTKRQRAHSPLRLAIAMPSTTATTINDLCSSSSEIRDITTTEEEADMANCLILLAKGKIVSHPVKERPYFYQCKTCERGFPSFRALGGHRARHKKMKPNHYEDYCSSTALSLQLSSDNRLSLNSAHNKSSSSKVHECSICGAEFSSGQALGGHMRRHRTLVNASSASTIIRGSPQSHEDLKKPTRDAFNLDLNLPAPDDEDHDSKFSFHSNDSVLVLSASPLVDCHY